MLINAIFMLFLRGLTFEAGRSMVVMVCVPYVHFVQGFYTVIIGNINQPLEPIDMGNETVYIPFHLSHRYTVSI